MVHEELQVPQSQRDSRRLRHRHQQSARGSESTGSNVFQDSRIVTRAQALTLTHVVVIGS